MTRSARLLLMLSLALSASCRKCPRQTTPPPTISLTPLPECRLPDLPLPIRPAIGFPTPEEILITKTDFALIVAYVTGLRDWIDAAAGCLQGSR